ncbi:ZinT/AdcA family metal-binding protein [Caviibacter abscessus]|uniref:ZinT/AdcA family metal-binding protein n=1 Tax=Caviibacter abscessus TaxID=1766719 RepID=UPI00082D99E9|nr:ZinT/AdcA family metal-binding protein [Caviibacter abscessus]
MKKAKLLVLLSIINVFSYYTFAETMSDKMMKSEHHHMESQTMKKSDEIKVAYKAKYMLEKGTYSIKAPHTHEHSFSIFFSNDDNKIIDRKTVAQKETFELENHVLYNIELAHYNSEVKFVVKEAGIYTLNADIAPGEALDYKIYDAQNKAVSASQINVFNMTKHNIYKGFFEDSMVKDRPTLDEWKGQWKSVYPYLLDGTLDVVMEHKAKSSTTMDKDAYKKYYKNGYKADVTKIVFNGNKATFYKKGKKVTAEYKYEGYRILTYPKGNRGVRFLFTATKKVSWAPLHIQFSDHNIYPSKPSHFHLYFGNENHEELLKELEHWPTYYPVNSTKQDIIHDMLAH